MNKEKLVIIPMIFVKIVLSVLFTLLTVRLYSVVKYGRATRRSRGKGPSLVSHRYSVRRAAFNLLWIVLGVETILHLNGDVRDDPLRSLHFSFVVPFVVLFVTQLILGYRIKGKEAAFLAKGWHHYIGYACIAFYVPMLITGLIMLWRI